MNIQFTPDTGGNFIANLQLLFIAFKLANIIDWSWMLVLLPLISVLGACALALLVVLIVWLADLWQDRKVKHSRNIRPSRPRNR